MTHPPYIFQSERLGFRIWCEADYEPFAALNADPIVMEHFPAPRTREQSDQSIVRFMEIHKASGYTFFAVDVLASKEFIGFIGLIPISFEAHFTPGTEIGWRLKKDAWGKGYATEGANACLDFAFQKLGIDEVFSFTAHSNWRSERVMQRIGMEKVGEFDHPKLPRGHFLERHVLYSIKAGE